MLRPYNRALLNFDLDVHAGRQIELRQGVDGLGPRIQDVDQPLVRLQLELLAALLVDVRAPEHGPQLPLGGQGNRPRDLRPGLLGGAHDVSRGLIDQGVVECLQTDANLSGHRSSIADFGFRIADLKSVLSTRNSQSPIRNYLRIFVTTPAPTVRPPSRIANRSCSSIAIGVISSIVIFVLSPGITISTPAGSSTLPVTSVVRK